MEDASRLQFSRRIRCPCYLLQEGICFPCPGRVSSPALEPGRALWTLLAASHAPVIRFCQEGPWWFQELPSEVELKLRMRLWSTRAWGQLVLSRTARAGAQGAPACGDNLPRSQLWQKHLIYLNCPFCGALQALVAARVGFCWSIVVIPIPPHLDARILHLAEQTGIS